MFLQLSVIMFTGGGVSEQTPPRQTSPPGQTSPPRQTPPGRTPPGQTPPETATAADGTHPTGMHSSKLILRMQSLFPHLETHSTLVKIELN